MTQIQVKLRQALHQERPHISARSQLRFFKRVLGTVVLCLGSVVVAIAQNDSPGQPCVLSPDLYERAGYKVKAIEIETPLDFLGVVRKPLEAKLTAAKSALTSQQRGLRLNEAFSSLGYTELLAELSIRIGTLEEGERFKLVATAPSLKSCDRATKTLTVVYWVVTSGPISYLSGIFEKRHDRLTREFAPGAFGRLLGKFLPQPFAGYNRSRALFAGTNAAYRFTNELIDKIDLAASGSSSSATGDFALAGERDFQRGLLEHAAWRLGYRYSNIPSDSVRLKGATGLGQFFAASRPLGSADVILRFGSSVEVGNRQSDLTQPALINRTLANSGYAAAKVYLGGTFNLGRQSWTGTYALQLGANSRAFRVDYVKQIVDSSYSVRFLPHDHKPFRIDAQFNAGHISTSTNSIPVSERFFGGNSTQEFIQGDDWQIRSTPFIRSFPQNRLNRVASGMPIGGEKFFSASLTFAQTVWSKPAIPREVLQDVRVKQALGGQLAGSRVVAISSYLNETPQFAELKQKLRTDTDSILKDIKQHLQSVNPDTVGIDLEEFGNEIEIVRDRIAERERDEDTGETKPSPLEFVHIKGLALGFNDQPETSKIGALIQTINNDILAPLQEAGGGEVHDRLKADTQRLEASRQSIQKVYEMITNLAATNLVELSEARAPLNEVGTHLNQLSTILDEIETQAPSGASADSEEFQNRFERLRLYVDSAKASVQAASGDDADIAKNNLQLLAVGFGPIAPAMLEEVIRYVNELQSPLAAAGMSSQGQRLIAATRELPRLQKQIKQGLKRVTVSEIERKANQDVAYTSRILDTTFRELNLIGISPVAMFDVARIGGRGASGFGGTRYGLGGGIRVSIVSLDLTTGYSWNPNRRPGEGRGAFVFSLDVSDLFR